MSRSSRRRFVQLTTAGIALPLLAGCSAAPSPTAVPTVAPTPKPAAPPAAPTTTAPAKPAATAAPKAEPPAAKQQATPVRQPAKVRMLQSSHGLGFSPSYIAQGNNYFADEAIDIDFQVVAGESVAQAAVFAGEAEVVAGSSSTIATMASQNLPGIAIFGINGSLTVHLTMRKGFLEQNRLTLTSPLKDRLAALKGTKLAAGTAASSIHRYLDFLVQQGGMALDKDVTPVFLPGPAPMMAALKAGQIDGFLLSPPTGEQMVAEGIGEIVFRAPQGEIPQFKSFVHSLLATRKDFGEKSPDILERYLRAMARANNFLIAQPEQSKSVLQKFFPDIQPDVLSASVDAMRPSFPRDGRMTEEQWKNVVDVLVTTGALKQAFDHKENAWWTNRYIKNVPAS